MSRCAGAGRCSACLLSLSCCAGSGIVYEVRTAAAAEWHMEARTSAPQTGAVGILHPGQLAGAGGRPHAVRPAAGAAAQRGRARGAQPAGDRAQRLRQEQPGAHPWRPVAPGAWAGPAPRPAVLAGAGRRVLRAPEAVRHARHPQGAGAARTLCLGCRAWPGWGWQSRTVRRVPPGAGRPSAPASTGTLNPGILAAHRLQSSPTQSRALGLVWAQPGVPCTENPPLSSAKRPNSQAAESDSPAAPGTPSLQRQSLPDSSCCRAGDLPPHAPRGCRSAGQGQPEGQL